MRDYPNVTSGYVSGMLFTGYLYPLALFLHRVLGYSIAGYTGWNLDGYNSQTSTASASTNIAAASNGQSLPQSTINVGSTTGFPASGIVWVSTSDGTQTVRYSGTTATTFTNCTGGTGTMTASVSTTTTGAQVLPTGTINVSSTTGFATSGTIYVVTTAGPQIVNYTGTTATSFTGCTGGTGTTSAGTSAVTSAGGSATYGPNKILSSSGTPPTITTTFPHGMSTGDYIQWTGSFAATGTAFSPLPTVVVSPTQLKLPNSAYSAAYTINSATAFPCNAFMIASGTNASINFAGAPSVYAVQVESTARTVVNGAAPSSGDVGRLLVIKSNSYPTKNSGVFKVSAANTATNSYTIDYRSSDTPPAESGMSWWLYEIETQASSYLFQPDEGRSNYSISAATNTAPIQITFAVNTVHGFITGQKVNISGVLGNTAANGTWSCTVLSHNTLLLDGSSGNGTYTSGGTITHAEYSAGAINYNSKIMLQSPHSTGWQIRLSIDPFNVPSVVPYTSISVGYGGISSGDFTPGGVTTLIPQYLNFNIPVGSPYANTVTGSAVSNIAPRITAIGDDTGRALFCYTRGQPGTNSMLVAGLPDNEPTPLAPDINRAFVYGGCSGASPDYGGLQTRFGTNFNIGFTYRDTYPEFCALAGFVDTSVTGTSPVYFANAGDCPFTNTTEVLPWEVWGGIAISPSLSTASNQTFFNFNQRFMGTAAFLRQGRSNFGTFTLSTDSTATSNISAASNTTPIQITTSSANALTTGQTVVISGVTGNTAANGTWVISVIDNTHFTLTGSAGNGSYLGSGTVQGTAHWLHLQNGIYMQWNGAGGLTP